MCLYLHECDDNSEVDLGYRDRRTPASGGGHLHPVSTLPHLWEPSVWVPALAEDQLMGLTPWAPILMDCWVLRLREGCRGVQVTRCQQSGQIRRDRGHCSTHLTVFMDGGAESGPRTATRA